MIVQVQLVVNQGSHSVVGLLQQGTVKQVITIKDASCRNRKTFLGTLLELLTCGGRVRLEEEGI